jgi:glutamyl-Q tRNA(Asp) synthetase
MTLAGRFAPSPTGPLHMGSLIAALASYLDIKRQGGEWFVRIDDLDPPRQDPNATALILRTLEAHGLKGDRPVDYQSLHQPRYQQAFEQIANQVFYCTCTRKALASLSTYPGWCREHTTLRPDSAVRIRAQGATFTVTDRVQGTHNWRPETDVGDFIVKRRDGLWAYNFATAVDDGSDVSQVVRGADLFHVTPQQIYMMTRLGLVPPSYCHLPVLCFPDGNKLSKQTHAPALNDLEAPSNLHQAMTYLGMQPPDQANWQTSQWLAWGLEHWQLADVPRSLKPYEPN